MSTLAPVDPRPIQQTAAADLHLGAIDSVSWSSRALTRLTAQASFVREDPGQALRSGVLATNSRHER
jgi:hypothetical protein